MSLSPVPSFARGRSLVLVDALRLLATRQLDAQPGSVQSVTKIRALTVADEDALKVILREILAS